jgi:hypothetical protein
MTDDETKTLRQEIEALKLQFADLKAAQNMDREEAIKAINEVHAESCRYVADIYNHLWPVLHKIFPKYAEVKKQIDDIIIRHDTSRREENS